MVPPGMRAVRATCRRSQMLPLAALLVAVAQVAIVRHAPAADWRLGGESEVSLSPGALERYQALASASRGRLTLRPTMDVRPPSEVVVRFDLSAPCLLWAYVRDNHQPQLVYASIVNWAPYARGSHELAWRSVDLVGPTPSELAFPPDWNRPERHFWHFAWDCQPMVEEFEALPYAQRAEFTRAGQWTLHGLHSSCAAPAVENLRLDGAEPGRLRVTADYTYANVLAPVTATLYVDAVEKATDELITPAGTLSFDIDVAGSKFGRILVSLVLHDAGWHFGSAIQSWNHEWPY